MQISSGCPAFDRDFQLIAAWCVEPVSSAGEAEMLLARLHRHFCEMDLSHYDFVKLYERAAELLDEFYDLRLALRSRIGDWQAKGYLNTAVERRLRDVFRALRFATDMVGELMIGYRRADLGRSHTLAFSAATRGTLFHPDYRHAARADFRSGDIIVFRGTRHNSAAIARIGDVDSQFSHAAIVYIDPRGRQLLVEALIEDGAIINSLHSALSHNLARAVVYRHNDPAIADRAAAFISDRVRRSRKFLARSIPYDFTMELDGYDELFCSKLVRNAFDETSGGSVVLPTYPTSFETAPRDFLDRIGVTARLSFAPGDMELEHDFHAIAEWRDFERTSDVRLQDFVMVKLFEWMEQDGYVFREDFSIHLLSIIGKTSGYLPDLIKTAVSSIIPKVPRNMSRRTISTIAMLHKTAQPLFEDLRKLERKSIRERGHPLHPREMLTRLEELRQKSPGRVGYLRTS